MREDLPRLRSVLRSIPIERLMIESNAPVLPPPPERSRRCEPNDLPVIADAIASLLSMDGDELRVQTAANARRRFGLDAR